MAESDVRRIEISSKDWMLSEPITNETIETYKESIR